MLYILYCLDMKKGCAGILIHPPHFVYKPLAKGLFWGGGRGGEGAVGISALYPTSPCDYPARYALL